MGTGVRKPPLYPQGRRLGCAVVRTTCWPVMKAISHSWTSWQSLQGLSLLSGCSLKEQVYCRQSSPTQAFQSQAAQSLGL